MKGLNTQITLILMNINEEISFIANQLADQGKKPSVALIKTRLSSPAPLPVIISTLKSWTHQPVKNKQEATKHMKKTSTIVEISHKNSATVKEIEELLLPIKKELVEIKQLLISLQKA